MRRLALVLVLPAALLLAPGTVQAKDSPLDQAKRAARQQSFEARVRVEWVDRRGGHVAELDVSSADGLMRMTGPGQETVVGADTRFLLDEAGWSLLWPGGAGHTDDAPLASKYELATGADGSVAGRPTVEVLVLEHGLLSERMAVDSATGLVLRRELLDRTGALVRLVEVKELRAGPAVKPAALRAPAPAHTEHPRTMAAVPAPFRAPAWLDGEYRRVGAFVRGHVVHVLYSDGLHALSLFAQAGRLKSGDLPKGGERVRIGRGGAVRWSWPGGDVVTWEAGGLVYTAVGDAPLEDVALAAASMPSARRLPLADRLRRTCRGVIEALTGGS